MERVKGIDPRDYYQSGRRTVFGLHETAPSVAIQT
jgi:hypothetical protein